MLRVGTAGWNIPRLAADTFSGSGTHLERYARVLHCAEINASFYRPLRFELYARWAALTPADFRFSVKMPRTITHEGRLRRAHALLEQFLSEVAGLRDKLGPLLVQLPPSLEFEGSAARTFFALLRTCHAGVVVCEPRHASWFELAAERVFETFHIGRVAADPARVSAASKPGGWLGEARDGANATVYYRLHGSPRIYWSVYPTERITTWADALGELPASSDVWCIFDNTAAGGALQNALELAACITPLMARGARGKRPSARKRNGVAPHERQDACDQCSQQRTSRVC